MNKGINKVFLTFFSLAAVLTSVLVIACRQPEQLDSFNTNSNQGRSIVSKVYAIGDLYPNEKNAVGVVFSVSNEGYHGKIVALSESSRNLSWATNKEFNLDLRLYSVDTETDDDAGYDVDYSVEGLENGLSNLAAIKTACNALEGATMEWDFTDSSFSAFYYCNLYNDLKRDSLVSGSWYLPSIDELHSLYENKVIVNKVLSTEGQSLKDGQYWSSSQYKDFDNSAWGKDFRTGNSFSASRLLEKSVRAISSF